MSAGCDCAQYAVWMARINGETPGAYYRNPRCAAHQDSFPDTAQQRAEIAVILAREAGR